MPRLHMIGRGSATCDVILMMSLMSLGAVFLSRYADFTHRNSRDFPGAEVTSEEDDSGGETPPSDSPSLSQQTIGDLLRRISDSRPARCRSRKYRQLPVATVVVVFSDYEFYDAKLTLLSILRDPDLSPLVTEVILVDDASSREQVLQDADNFIRSVSRSFPVVRLVRLGTRVSRVRARSLAVDQHVTNDVVIFVDAGVMCIPGWLSPLLELVSTAADGQTTIAVPHYDHLTHPITLQYVETDSDLVASLSWSLTVRMRRRGTSRVLKDDGQLSRSVAVLRGEVFAVRRSFLSSIGGLYDDRLEDGTGVGEHVELSLRTWLCGGSIKVRLTLLYHYWYHCLHASCAL